MVHQRAADSSEQLSSGCVFIVFPSPNYIYIYIYIHIYLKKKNIYIYILHTYIDK